MVSLRRSATKASVVAWLAAATCLAAAGCGSSSQGTPASQATRSAHATTRAARFSPAVQQAYIKFAGCMHAHGVAMPPPNIAGPGPVFDPRRIDTKSPHFASALSTCRAQLLAATATSTSTSAVKSSG
jgi:hypothetical protein